MSKIGIRTIKVPSNVELEINDKLFKAKGPKGSLELALDKNIKVLQEDESLKVEPKDIKKPQAKVMWGTYRSLINNIIIGVSEGFQKKLEINGTGYKVSAQGSKLTLEVGFSHPVIVEAPQEINFKVEKNIITVEGIEKQLVGQWAAKVRDVKRVEPYKGKGIKYVDEYVRRKVGKKAAGEGA
ncbi:MAG: 50S ribosomal protein L6 [Candidatus Moranbacteria bacterium]|nr:50S ribosomal protein L6 [Candidatus Moranbacteria bacterium]